MSHDESAMSETINLQELRAAAESRLAASADVSLQSNDALLHELQVHQIELEMQNESLRLSQIELEASRDRFLNSYEMAPVGFVTLNRQGMIIAANLTCAALLQEERLTLLRRRFDTQLVRQDVERWNRHLTEVWNGKQMSSAEVRLKRSDGSTIPVLLSIIGVPEEASPVVHIAITDITERIKAESLLRESKKLAQDIIDGSSSMIYALDNSGNFTLANKKLLALFNVNREQLIGRARETVLPEAVARVHRDHDLTVLRTGVPVEFEEINLEADGEHVYLSQKGPLFDEKGGVIGIFGFSTDITEYKRMARETLQATLRYKDVLTDAIGAIAATLEQRDPYTAGHQRRVAELAVAIGREMGLEDDRVKSLYFGGLIHDIGKISVPTEILGKPGRLNDIEFGLIQTHAEAGFEIIKDIDFPWPVPEMVRQHHERMDGSGYLQGLMGEQILPEARILAVADVVEAMSANRPYRAGLGIQAALDELTRERGTLLDATAVDACLRIIREKGFTFSK